jgi:DNA (cytosine-5)-methyltransferase 1
VDSGGKAAGKGALIQTDMTGTLSTVQDQYLFQPVSIENHPADSRVDIDDSGKVQTLTSRMGTGGGNVPMVMEPVAYDGSNITSPINATNPQPGDPCHTLNTDTRNYVVEPICFEPGAASRLGGYCYENKCGTLRAEMGDNQFSVAYSTPVLGFQRQLSGVECQEDSAPTLLAAAGESGNNKPCVAYGIQGSMIGRADQNGPQGDGVNENVSFTLNTTDRHAVCYNIGSYHSNAWKSDNPNSGVYEADKSKTLDALQCGYPGCNQGGTAVVEPAYCIGNGQVDQLGLSQKVGTLNCMHDQQAVLIPVEEPIVIDRAFFNQGQNAQYEPQCYVDGTVPTLVAKGPSAVAHGVDCRNATEYEEQTGTLQSDCYHNHNSNNVVRVRYIVRRLTPLECERLQGFPDGWTDIGEWVDSKGKKHKEADSPRYKALGNSIALPPWKWILKKLCACYERDATMASLFDGIGGFPLIWEQLNGKGSCLWASEIEEFPMAVTKLRFGGSDNG